MYKVFFKSKPLIFTTSDQIEEDNGILIDSKSSKYSSLIKILKSKSNNSVYFYNPDPNKLLNHFEKCFLTIDAAGGMVLNDFNKYLLIFRNNKWDLPKGHLKKKELNLEGASREVQEETGVNNLNPISILPTTYHFVKKNKTYKVKKTRWFLFNTKFKGNLIPQLDEGIIKVEWKTKSEIKKCLPQMYPNIKNLFENHFTQSLTELGTSDS